MVANAGNMIDLQQMKEEGISEEEWKKTTMAMSNGKVVNFFTGSLVIDGQNQPSQSLTLKRGVARFDLNVDVAGSAAIESLTLKNVAQSGYLFAQGEVAASPADVERNDVTAHFDTALSASTPGVLYVYEQENAGIEVSIEAVIDGQHKVLTKTLEGNLKRNTIYTVTEPDLPSVTETVKSRSWSNDLSVSVGIQLHMGLGKKKVKVKNFPQPEHNPTGENNIQ